MAITKKKKKNQIQQLLTANATAICHLQSKIISSPKVQHFLRDAFAETYRLVAHE